MICFTAKDISVAKKFIEFINKRYSALVRDTLLLEDIFSIKICGMLNPKLDDLKEFYASA